MRLGTHVTTITPQVPIDMGGYGARLAPATGVHDPLTARALVLEDGPVKVGLVVADLLMFSRLQAEAIRQRASALTGIPPGHLVVAATHTHSGPAVSSSPPFSQKADPVYGNWVVEAAAGALYQAAERLEEVWAGWAMSEVEGVGGSRRASAPTAPEVASPTTMLGKTVSPDRQPLGVLSLARPDGALRAVLVNFQCHPTVLGADNLLISADLAGAARDALKGLLGPDVFVAFVNGACGDVSPRFTRRAQTFGELRRLGGLLGAAAATAALRAECRELPPGSLRVGTVEAGLPIRDLPSAEEAQEQLARMKEEWERAQATPGLPAGALRLARTALEGAQVQALLALYQGEVETRAELVGWRLNGPGEGSHFGLVTIPGELFASLGDAIRGGGGLGCTFVAGYSGGEVGYIPDRQAYAEGGYEVLSSPFAPEAGETLASAAANLLRSLA